MAEATNITRGLFGQRLSKRLPWMVDWFDPVLLGLVGIRTLISTTIGQYADQRPIQAAMDREDNRTTLALRHDFSGARAKELVLDKDGALWVDFIADLGDGYEATYAMAYLMASSTLAVRGADTPDGKLDGGEILIFGGDLAYPNATVKEYQDRCLDPYDAAFPGEGQREKKLFFIAGNHDWYDGLAAFTSVFCAARSYAARGLKIGGWRCEQRRSYFALKLPHDWWIWGFDSGLSDSIDEAQSVYFAAAAKETKPNDKIILVTHTPAWIDRHDEGLTEIAELVRETAKEKPGLEICAVIYFLYAWFYAVSIAQNYLPEKLPAVSAEEAAAARGSAIAAASQARPALDRFLDLAGQQNAVPELKTAAAASKDAADKTKNAVEAVRAEVDKAAEAEAALKRALAAKESDAATAVLKAPGRTVPSADVTAAAEAAKKKLEDAQAELDRAGKEAQAAPGKVDEARAKAYKEADTAIELAYAAFAELDAASSRLQGQPGADDLVNAAAQARVVMDQARSAVQHAEKIEARATMLKDHAKKLERKWDTSGTKLWSELLKAALNNPGFLFMLVALWFGLVYYVDAALTSAWLSWLNWPIKLWFGSLHFAYHISALVFVDWVAHGVNSVFKVITGTLLVAGSVIWAGFGAAWKYGSETGPDAQQKMAMQFQEDLAWFGKCWEKLQTTGHQDWTGFGHCVAGNYDLGLQISTILAHATTSIVLGGILGAFIFGFYWVTTTAMFGMHMDAFSALGLRDYKNFLRMRFEQDKATIYAIGLDQVPGRYGWRRPKNGEVLPDNKPQIQPKRPLRPHVIEKFVIARERKPETPEVA